MTDAIIGVPFSANHQPVIKGRRKSAFSQALALQDVLHKLALNGETQPRDVAACARAWDVLEDRKREMRGVPKSGQRRLAPDKPAPAKALPVPTED
jgi:hypothetical protein